MHLRLLSHRPKWILAVNVNLTEVWPMVKDPLVWSAPTVTACEATDQATRQDGSVAIGVNAVWTIVCDCLGISGRRGIRTFACVIKNLHQQSHLPINN